MQVSNQSQSADQLLDELLSTASPSTGKASTADDTPGTFQDSDGLVSFVNLSTSFVTKDPKFATGRQVADMVANFFASMRGRVFSYLQANPAKVLPGDTVPATQWDPSVTHFMQNLMVQAGGFSAFQITQETYSETQTTVDFSMDMIKMIFDAMVLPENLVADATKFIQGVGNSLRISWDDRSKSYRTCLVGLCHEAVQTDSSGTNFIYFPKIKYYYISVDSSQQEFTSPCVNVDKVTFNFNYDYYVTAIKASVLDNTTDDYKNFVAFLQKAQNVSFKTASNSLEDVLDSTSSSSPASAKGAIDFGVDLNEYPKISVEAPAVTN